MLITRHMLTESFTIEDTNITTLSFISNDLINAVKHCANTNSLQYIPEFYSVPASILQFIGYCYGNRISNRIPKLKFIQDIENINHNDFKNFEYILNNCIRDSILVYEVLKCDMMDINDKLIKYDGKTVIEKLSSFGFIDSSKYINYPHSDSYILIRDLNNLLVRSNMYEN